MQKVRVIFVFCLAVIVVGLFVSLFIDSRSNPEVYLSSIESASAEEYFVEATHLWPKGQRVAQEEQLAAVLVPHHAPASPMIAHALLQLSHQTVDRIILFGPNHAEAGGCKVVTSEEYKQKWFAKNDLVCVDEAVLRSEQSLNTLQPFIIHYLGSPTVVPFLLSNFLSLQEVEELSTVIQDEFTDRDVLVGSVDFSHYLSLGEANEKDLETLLYIQEKKYAELLAFDQDNLDSPETVVTIQKILADTQTSLVVQAHENFVSQQSDKTQPSTSYFELLWYRETKNK